MRLAVLVCVVGSLQGLAGTSWADDGVASLVEAGNRWAYSEGRPFLAASEWNTPLPQDVAVDPLSDDFMSRMAPSLVNDGNGFWLDMNEWTVPVWYADDSTPRYDIPCRRPWGCGPGFGQAVPIPENALPDPRGDGHMAVVDLAHNLSYEFFEARRTDGGWEAGRGMVSSIDPAPDPGTFVALGVTQPLGYQQQNYRGWGSARVAGVSLLGGLIRYQEMKDGLIPHALAFAYPFPKGDAYVAPATHTIDRFDPDSTRWDNLPIGARLRLRPDVDVAGRCGGNRACEIIGRAMQDYGIYLVDLGSASAIYAEGLYGKDVSWAGLLDESAVSTFGASDLQVVQLPPYQFSEPQ